MGNEQNNQEYLLDMVQRGVMTPAEANVAKVRMARVFLVKSKIPANERKQLNAAVKRGELGHVKRNGHKPEAYYHPEFEYLVNGERNKEERRVKGAVNNILK